MARLCTLAAAVFGLSLFAAAAQASTPCTNLASLRLNHVTVMAVADAPAGPITACRVEVISRPTADSEIRIEVWIPEGKAWNGRYLQLGNGGLAGSIQSGALKVFAEQGYAVAMTDDGHEAIGTDGRWALGHPEKIVDFGWRALKETTDAAKALIVAYRGGPARHAYFMGCSDGGREALMEAQRFPDDFDGIVAGAPANHFTALLTLAAYDAQVLAKPGAFLPADKLGTLEAGAQKACGGGFFVADPEDCRFHPSDIICKGDDAPDCISAAQAEAATALYRGLGPLNPGYTPGEEGESGAWLTWIVGASEGEAKQALIQQFAKSFWGDFVFGDPDYDIQKLDLATAPAAAAKLAADLDSTNPDLSRFRAHGGKLIQYHGWNDPAIPAQDSVIYYEDVEAHMGGAELDGFYRLYMVPGMLHCGDGPGPSHVDWLGLAVTWVEKHHAPGAFKATRQQPSPEPAWQTLCPYPATSPDPQGHSCISAEIIMPPKPPPKTPG